MRWRSASFLLLAAACSSTATPTPSGPSIVSLDSDGRRSVRLQGSEDRPNMTLVPGTVTQVWSALPEVYEELEIGGAVVDPGAFTFGQRNFSVRRRLAGEAVSQSLNCGASVAGVANANSYTVTLSVITGVRQEPGGGTGVTTWIEGFAQATGRSDHPVRCGTTGALERRIAAALTRRFLPAQ